VLRLRPSQLADHTLFILYRWIAWSVTALIVLWAWPIETAVGVVLVASSFANLLATIFVQPYVQLARSSPSIMSLDIFYCVVVLVASGGWQSSFLLYSYASLVLPALIFGWRGGLMAGLSYVTMSLAGLWAAGAPPSELLLDGPSSGAQLVAMMIVPPAFGSLVALVVELVRRRAGERRPPRRAAADGDRSGQRARAASSGFAAFGRPGAGDDERTRETALTTQIVRVRTTEQGVEELRRALFAPFPATDLDLAGALDLLAVRFEKLTGATARVTLLGRTRAIHHVHRELLVRLTQEALINIRQHAGASAAMLTLRFDATSVALLVQDDGVGLVDGTYERPGLHALRAMHYRLAEFGGRLDVFETEGGGVTVRATMPLE
jgi:hypothetical protein